MKSGTIHTIIKQKTLLQDRFGFCLPLLEQEEFEFHFTAFEDARKDPYYVNYYKMHFHKDLISVMKRCGGIPESSMDSYVETIEERNRFE